MTREEVEKNIGALVKINGNGDLAIIGEMRKYIYDDLGAYCIRIEKLTKGGKVVCRCGKDVFTVAPRNVDLYGQQV